MANGSGRREVAEGKGAWCIRAALEWNRKGEVGGRCTACTARCPHGTGTSRCLLQVVVCRLQQLHVREGNKLLAVLRCDSEQVVRGRLPVSQSRVSAGTLLQHSSVNTVGRQ